MEEIIRPRRIGQGGGPSGLGDPLAPPQSGDATVISGPYAEQLPVGGMTIGQIRRRYGDRFDLAPNSQAILDGNPADENTSVRPGQVLNFVRRSGEKGTGKVIIEGKKAEAVSPEGQTASVPVARFLDMIQPPRMDTGGVILPDGVKAVIPGGPVTVWVHEIPPRVHYLKWIAADSGPDYGPGTEYRDVRIALPYVIVLGIFIHDGNRRPLIGQSNECFFRTEPLRSLKDPVFYPALLNCSKFDPPDGRPLSWICTQFMRQKANQIARESTDPNETMRRGMEALLHCLLETGFNYSSEHHELTSWFTASAQQDPRITTIERWEEETTKDPNFVLDVPWLEVGMSLHKVIDRAIANVNGHTKRPGSAADLARLIFNSRRRPVRRRLRIMEELFF